MPNNIAELTEESSVGGDNLVPIQTPTKDINQAAITEAKQLRKRAEALVAGGVEEDDKIEILELVNQTTSAVKAGDGSTITRLNQSLSDVLFYLED